MRFFIFPIESIHIAVAADKVSKFISHDMTEAEQTVIPLYILFTRHQKNENVSFHGIVLKQEICDNKKIVIMTPPIEEDINVSQEEIQSLPDSFSGVYSSFNGIYFYRQKLIFFLDIENFISLWQTKHEFRQDVQ